jgi:hypothetical protein
MIYFAFSSVRMYFTAGSALAAATQAIAALRAAKLIVNRIVCLSVHHSPLLLS